MSGGFKRVKTIIGRKRAQNSAVSIFDHLELQN